MTFAKSERAELCDLFDRVGPDAPTLCQGWATHDLAAHLWIRETDPVGVSGLVAQAGASVGCGLCSVKSASRTSANPTRAKMDPSIAKTNPLSPTG